MDRTNHIPTAMSNYVTERDNFRARYKGKESGLLVTSSGGPLSFNTLINGHAETLAHLLPEMNLAQWEALSELVNSRLNQMRMIESQK